MKKTRIPLVLLLSTTPLLVLGGGPYSYSLQPGTPAWDNATPAQRVQAATVPKSWRDTASSAQLFGTAVTNPFFRGIVLSGNQTLADAYNATKSSGPLAILSDAESTSDFGTQALTYLRGLNIITVASATCSQSNGICWMDYIIICHMAETDNALNKMGGQSSIQTLFRLAVWDANYFTSQQDYQIASADVRLMYSIYNKPESFRGAFPPGFSLPILTSDHSYALDHEDLPPELVPVLSSAKSALNLTARP